jgi:dTDP-4-dehydrorhamnose 3,5-epimerase
MSDLRSAIEGVRRRPLQPHVDDRGTFVELFRDRWFDAHHPVQWNLVRSEANVLRGFHAHVRHTDALVVLDGRMVLGLQDLRRSSPTFGLDETLVLEQTAEVVLIPPGVGHGFYLPERALIAFGVSHEWATDDELGCRWDDPDLRVRWGCDDPALSERDRTAGTLGELVEAVAAGITPSPRGAPPRR